MAGSDRPDQTGNTGAGHPAGGGEDDLERRRRALDAALASSRPAERSEGRNGTGGMAGVGQALRLSSEFIAGVAVGAALGWFLDSVAGTSPWGLIVFLLLGFAAGVLTVLRTAGMIADVGPAASSPGSGENVNGAERRD
jgi:ATP synthase protein I